MQGNTNQFVIHLHQLADSRHWDLMLLKGEVLQTYRLDKPLEDIVAGEKGVAEKIGDHNIKFLDYEGLVNKGTATVKLAHKGSYSVTKQRQDDFELRLLGKELDVKLLFNQTGENLWGVESVSD